MRILIYSDDSGFGGTAVNAHALALGLKKRGRDVTVALSPGDERSFHERAQAGADTVWLPFDTVKAPTASALRHDVPLDIIRQTKPDAILFNDGSPLSSLGAKQAALELGVPPLFLCNYVSAGEAYDPGLLPYAKNLYALADATVAVSSENLRLLRTLFEVPEERSQVVYNGVADRYFERPPDGFREDFRARTGIPQNAMVCFTAARFEARKGYGHLLEAARRVSRMDLGRPVYFVWCGHPGADYDALAAAVPASGLENSVFILGLAPNVKEWLAASDVFLLPSEAEGMPLCLIEAMASGLPVAASAVSGVPELLGDVGLLLPDPSLSPEATVTGLVQVIAVMAQAPERFRAFAPSIRARADYFRADRMAADYDRLLTAIARPQGAYSPRIAPRGRSALAVPGLLGFKRYDALACETLGLGWCDPETWGVWSLGEESDLRIPLENVPDGEILLVFSFRSAPSNSAKPVQAQLGATGVQTSFAMAPGSSRIVHLRPPRAAGASGRLDLVLSVDEPRKPCEHEPGSVDNRPLGLGLEWIWALSGPPESWPEAFLPYAVESWRQEELQSETLRRFLARFAGPAAHGPANRFHLPASRLMRAVFDRIYPQAGKGDWNDPAAFEDFAAWYYAHACGAFGLWPLVSQEEKTRLALPNPDSGGSLPVFPLYAELIHHARPDLAREFDLSRFKDRQRFLRWIVEYGQEYFRGLV